MKKSITLFAIGFVFAAGVAVTQFPPLRASAQPSAAVPDDGGATLQVLQGQTVTVAPATPNAGAWEGKVISVKDGWITLDVPALGNGKEITRIPLTRVMCITSTK